MWLNQVISKLGCKSINSSIPGKAPLVIWPKNYYLYYRNYLVYYRNSFAKDPNDSLNYLFVSYLANASSCNVKNPVEHIRMSIVKSYPAQRMKYVRYTAFRVQVWRVLPSQTVVPHFIPSTWLNLKSFNAEKVSSNVDYWSNLSHLIYL